jgi:hypothetical protein
VDDAGQCCGIVSQADVARHAPERKAGEVVKEVSRERRPSAHPSPPELRARRRAIAFCRCVR